MAGQLFVCLIQFHCWKMMLIMFIKKKKTLQNKFDLDWI